MIPRSTFLSSNQTHLWWQAVSWVNPHKAVLLDTRQGSDAHVPADRRGRHFCAGACGVELPTVVGTLHLTVHHLSQGERAGAVGALVLDTRRLTMLVAEQDPGLVEDVKGDHHVLF